MEKAAQRPLHPLLERQIREARRGRRDGSVDYDRLFEMIGDSYRDMESPMNVGAVGVTLANVDPVKQVEQRFLSIIENVPGMVYQWYERTNGEQGFYYVSPRCQEIFGRTVEEMIENNPVADIHPDDMDRWRDSVAEAVEKRADWSFEGRFVLPDGSIRWWRGLSKPTLVSEDELVFDGIILDISAEKRLADRLSHVVKGLAFGTGAVFLQSLIEHMALAMGMRCAMIGVFDQEPEPLVETLVLWDRGKILPNTHYRLAGTPCGKVVSRGICMVADHVQDLYPEDDMLRDLEARSYIGTELRGADGQPIGILVCVGEKPLSGDSQDESFFQIFASRASMELQCLLRERKERAA